jgi:hypothetical protein
MKTEKAYSLLVEYRLKLQAALDNNEGDHSLRDWMRRELAKTDRRIEARWK